MQYNDNGTSDDVLINQGTRSGWYNGFRQEQLSFSVRNPSDIWAVFIESMYYSTPSKLQRYNGTSWNDYTSVAGVPSNPHLVSVGANNDVFVASEDTIAKYDGISWKHIGAVDNTSWDQLSNISTGQVIAMKTSSSGDLYISVIKADSLNEIRHYNGSEWESVSLGYGINKLVLSLAIDSSGTIYAGTLNGLYRVSGEKIEKFSTEGEPLPVPSVKKLVVDKTGVLWASSDYGVLKFDGSNWSIFTQEDGLPDSSIVCIALSQSGNVWAGTSKGIGFYDGTLWKTYTSADGLLDNNIKQIVSSPDGKIYVLSESGINCFDGVSWSDKTTASFKIATVSITVDNNGKLWTGYTNRYNYTGYDTLNLISDDTDISCASNFRGMRQTINSIAVGPDNSIWVGVFGNITGSAHTTEIRSKIFKMSGNTIYDESIGFIDAYGLYSEGFIQGVVTDIKFDQNNSSWISLKKCFSWGNDGMYYFGGGVMKDMEQQFKFTKENSGLLDNDVYSLAPAPDGSIWFSTASGLCRYGEPNYSLGVESDETATIPQPVKLNANYPNPFNPSTTISFNLQEPGMTKLSIYNISGQKVL